MLPQNYTLNNQFLSS